VRSVLQARPAIFLPALEPLVSCLARDPEEGAQLGEAEDVPVERLDEADLLVHG